LTKTRIYFDNAASSFPKPEEVIEAQSVFLRTCGNPGRGAHYFALEGARKIFDARENIADFLGLKQSERLIFTGGCTASINMVVHGLALDGRFAAGDVVIVSSLEHNAVMRPLAQLRERLGIKIVMCPVGPNFQTNLQALVEKHEPKLVALVWASNVTGEVLPIEEVAVFLNERKIPLLVDGAQVAGKIETDLSAKTGISFFCTSGHKGLMGPPGVGLLYVAPQHTLAPFVSGGTGSRSESLDMPTAYPDRLEAGTLPGPAIAGLSAGVDWLKGKKTKAIFQNELALLEKFLQWNSKEKLVRVFDTGLGSKLRMPLVSFASDNISPAEMADRLDTEYGIAVRSGLHCSASSHETLGTLEQGLVRVSFGPFNTEEEVSRLCDALFEVTKK
jgi:cysteine desulfurase / selenocysteine lyase